MRILISAKDEIALVEADLCVYKKSDSCIYSFKYRPDGPVIATYTTHLENTVYMTDPNYDMKEIMKKSLLNGYIDLSSFVTEVGYSFSDGSEVIDEIEEGDIVCS